jgi:hypothetical protein
MIRPLRRAHAAATAILAVTLPLILVAALMARRAW